MNTARKFAGLSWLFCFSVMAGCSTVDVRAKIDPAGGALTDSIADVYDFDRDGIWYLVFIHQDGIVDAVHRHNPGIHLFLDGQDILFQCRCSGRGEVVSIENQLFKLSNGTVFLCDMENGNTGVQQLPISALACDGYDPESIAKAIYEISLNPRVAAFLSDETRIRLAAQWKIATDKKVNYDSLPNPK